VSQASIRPYRDSDLDDLYRICLQTGDSGEDATSKFEDPRILGDVFAAPYGLFEPSLAFVAEDETGVGGYIVRALDTRAADLIHAPLTVPDELARVSVWRAPARRQSVQTTTNPTEFPKGR